MSERRRWLAALSERCGILPEYVDVTGRRRVASESTRIELLEALGFDGSTERSAERAVRKIDAGGRRLVDAVRVASERNATSVSIAPGASALGECRRLDWSVRIELESGERVLREGRSHLRQRGSVRIPLGLRLPLGYHRLFVQVADAVGGRSVEAGQQLIVAPDRCPTQDLTRRRRFGIMANAYTLRSRRNWGIGDLGDVRSLVDWAAEQGASFVGLNPLCALDAGDPSGSPYSPSSRLFPSPLYLEVERVPEWRQGGRELLSKRQRRELEQLRASDSIDYGRVWRSKRRALWSLYRIFERRARDGRRARAYERFVRCRGRELERFATFCALQEHLSPGSTPSSDWRLWPSSLRDPESAAVASFQREHRRLIGFHSYLQFELERQLGLASSHADAAGACIGLLHDLPLGSAPGGADTWSDRGLFVERAEIGAPPDPIAPGGQNWGFSPMDPQRLHADGYRSWSALLRASLRHAGALRIDHVMGLFRQYWIPKGARADRGAYVLFPSASMLAILALESQRAGAVVIGEDLGTVPEGVRPALSRVEVHSTRVLYFERTSGGGFRAPSVYPRKCFATANTHDLIPLAGYWQGRDHALRARQGGTVDAAVAATRAADKRRLLARLRAEKLWSGRCGDPEWSPALAGAVHDLLYRSPARLVAVSLDDLAGEVEPVNLPGAGADLYPSWKRRMERPFEELRRDPEVVTALGRRARRRTSRRRAT